MQPLHIKTPLIESQFLRNQLNKQVMFKLEALQPSGSFKIRGIGHFCQQAALNGATHFVASSGGNAGIAVAYSGMKLQIPTTIFIPKSSHPLYIQAIKSFGAEVMVSGHHAGEAQEAAMDFSKTHHATYIHPFDHPEIWKGHSSLIDEVATQNPSAPDVVITAVGGGGLACGILEGMHQNGWDHVPLIAVETVGADVFSQSMKLGRPTVLSSITSQATSLGSTYVAPKLLEWTAKHPIINTVVSDDEAIDGSIAFAHDKRILVEMASGAALSLVYNNHPLIAQYQSILVIVCGGVNTSHFNDA